MPEPEALTTYLVARAAVGGAVLAAAFGLVICAREWWGDLNHKRLAHSILFLIASGTPISVIGFLVGYLTATSRAGAVGNLLPALMALLAGLHIYVFGKELHNRIIVSFLATLLTIMIFYGVQYGAYRRDTGREARIMENIRLEYRIKKIRENLGLTADLPGWAVGVEAK